MDARLLWARTIRLPNSLRIDLPLDMALMSASIAKTRPPGLFSLSIEVAWPHPPRVASMKFWLISGRRYFMTSCVMTGM